jgi:HEAT repeat protein
MSYLASVCGQSARTLFSDSLRSPDEQTQLETVIAIGETATSEAVELLSELLDQVELPYFLRSAAAWCLGQIGSHRAVDKLISLFSDVDLQLREEALDRIVSLGGNTISVLLDRLGSESTDTASGCAEALRQQERLSKADISRLLESVTQPERSSDWAVWLLGNLPREQVAPIIAELQTTAPQLHYAISLLWSFMESWIARRWELRPGTDNPVLEDMDVA